MSSDANTMVMPRQLGLPVVLQSRWLWCILVTAFCVFRTFGDPAASLNSSLGDTDDATRLLFVRELLAGGSWFDVTTTRLGGPTPLVSHWSRLIDLPITALVWTLSVVVPMSVAETIVRVLWPAIVLTVFLRILVREIEVRAGVEAALLFLVLAATCMSGLFQFSPGRIDHHNVMITGTVGGLVMLTRIATVPAIGTAAGIAVGVALSVGYEPLALTLAMLAALSLAAVFKHELREGMARAAIALAATLCVVFFSTVAPSRYLTVTCDALALNMILFSVGAAVGLEALRRQSRSTSSCGALAILSLPTLLGVAAYVSIEPVCLGGPFAQVDPAVKSIWLDTVQETRSMFAMLSDNPIPMIVVATSLAVGLLASASLWMRQKSIEASLILMLVVVASPLAIWQVKLVPYAVWMATVSTVLWIASLRGTELLTPLTARLSAAMVLNQSTLALVASALLALGGTSSSQLSAAGLRTTEQCRATATVSALANLPRGFIVAPTDLGPYIVALTHHDALAAPYHRIDRAIIAAHEILDGDAAQSEARLRAFGATYVALCVAEAQNPGRQAAGLLAEGLQTKLLVGEHYGYLEEVDLGVLVRRDLRIWKLVPQSPRVR